MKLIEGIEERSIERHQELKKDIAKVTEHNGDLRQLAFNLNYLFDPATGTFVETVKDVKRHNRYEIGMVAIIWLAGMLKIPALLKWGKELFGTK